MEVFNPITSVHGRVLVERTSDPTGVLVGFHGYAQLAEDMLEQLNLIPGADRWTRVSIQALHPFYTRGDSRVVASWMTRQDRELAIADNIGYVESVCTGAPVHMEHKGFSPCVFVGFSQGAAMAYRAALRTSVRAAGIIALAGDIPPDVKDVLSTAWPPVLIGVGDREEWYAGDKLESDLTWLRERGIRHDLVRFSGGHEWTDEFRAAAGLFLLRVSGGG
ncbi:MAG: phospholipase [Acidimicrobiia bacterium]|nr:phospholipase [Acidimicrobiia bacterium]